MTNLLLCGCEPHGHKCLISEGGCGRCFEHCVCTPSGVASTGAGRAEDTGSPGPLRLRPLAQSLAGLLHPGPGVVACPYRAALLQGIFGEFKELIDNTTVAFLLDVIVEARRRAERDAKGEQ